jgi:hypothetical protein
MIPREQQKEERRNQQQQQRHQQQKQQKKKKKKPPRLSSSSVPFHHATTILIIIIIIIDARVISLFPNFVGCCQCERNMEDNQSEKITPTTKLFAGSQKQFTPTTPTTTTKNTSKIEIRATKNKTKQNKQTNKKPHV